MLYNHKNTKKQGDEGLGAAISYFTSRGDCVNIPLTDSQEYDLIADCGGTLRRVQVKTTTYKTRHGSYFVSLTIKGGNQTRSNIKPFDNSKIDFVFVLTPESKYLVPANILGNSFTLGEKYNSFKI